MIPAEDSRRPATRQADRDSGQPGQAATRGQVPARPVRPARPVSLRFSRGQIPATAGAACATHDPGLWFSHLSQDIAKAKAICHDCPDQAQFLAGALQHRETHGIWGGTDLNPGPCQEDAA